MCAYFKDDVIPEADLPVRFAGYNSAFRREVGSAGKDTRGILRVHHFNKLEMESFTDAANSYKEHEFMIAIQEYLLQQLELPYQVMLKCTFDMGSPNARGVDIETWMPGQELYRETHSADYITDYQTRGLKTKVATTDVKSLPTLMMLLQ
jgi:seryl-tRNA synthetase